mmetsp:Transcript_65828/g.174554  ORF Transcript_65828/g.174554 Transcript_65828/m.174554 type:complete len:96 (-) Transcript_65828:786-1073(-)
MATPCAQLPLADPQVMDRCQASSVPSPRRWYMSSKVPRKSSMEPPEASSNKSSRAAKKGDETAKGVSLELLQAAANGERIRPSNWTATAVSWSQM